MVTLCELATGSLSHPALPYPTTPNPVPPGHKFPPTRSLLSCWTYHPILQLSRVSSGDFQGLEALRELDLSHNPLVALPDIPFSNLGRPRRDHGDCAECSAPTCVAPGSFCDMSRAPTAAVPLAVPCLLGWDREPYDPQSCQRKPAWLVRQHPGPGWPVQPALTPLGPQQHHGRGARSAGRTAAAACAGPQWEPEAGLAQARAVGKHRPHSPPLEGVQRPEPCGCVRACGMPVRPTTCTCAAPAQYHGCCVGATVWWWCPGVGAPSLARLEVQGNQVSMPSVESLAHLTGLTYVLKVRSLAPVGRDGLSGALRPSGTTVAAVLPLMQHPA